MADLKTNYVDDVLDSSKNQLRKYQQIQNDDGTVSFVDVTEYSTTGTSFGAKDINDTNAAVNELNESLVDSLAWKYHGDIATNSEISSIRLPAKFEELSLEIYQTKVNERKLKIHLTKNEVKSYAQTFYTGAYYSASNFCGAAIRVDDSGIYHYGMTVNGSEVQSTCEIRYR